MSNPIDADESIRGESAFDVNANSSGVSVYGSGVWSGDPGGGAVVVGRPAVEVDHDDGLASGGYGRRGLNAQQVGKGKPAHAQSADFEEVTAGKAVAEVVGVAMEVEHRRFIKRR